LDVGQPWGGCVVARRLVSLDRLGLAVCVEVMQRLHIRIQRNLNYYVVAARHLSLGMGIPRLDA